MHTPFGKLILVFLCLCMNHSFAESFKECMHVAHGTFVAIEMNCTGYIYCIGENSYAGLCAVGTYFDPQLQQCTDDISFKCPEYIAEGVEKSEPQQQQLTTLISPDYNAASTAVSNGAATPETTVTTILEVSPSALSTLRPHCNSAVDEYFPYQQRCEYYYKCTRGYLSILRCNFGDGWDFLLEKCVPFKKAQCYRIWEV